MREVERLRRSPVPIRRPGPRSSRSACRGMAASASRSSIPPAACEPASSTGGGRRAPTRSSGTGAVTREQSFRPESTSSAPRATAESRRERSCASGSARTRRRSVGFRALVRDVRCSDAETDLSPVRSFWRCALSLDRPRTVPVERLFPSLPVASPPATRALDQVRYMFMQD